MPEKVNLSIILIVYNEQDNIAEAIDRAYKIAKKITNEFELLILYSEASTDKTEDIIKDMMLQHPEIKIVYRPRDRTGYGYGLKLGIQNAKYEYIFYTDGDNQFDMDTLETFIPYLKDYDIVNGTRKIREDPLLRRICGIGYNIIIDVLFFQSYLDVDCAFKIYKKKIFKNMVLRYDTGFTDADILIKAKRMGFKIKTIPVKHFPRKKGKSFSAGSFIRLAYVIKDLLRDIFKERFNLWDKQGNFILKK